MPSYKPPSYDPPSYEPPKEELSYKPTSYNKPPSYKPPVYKKPVKKTYGSPKKPSYGDDDKFPGFPTADFQFPQFSPFDIPKINIDNGELKRK
jgi:hypothetical protein